MKRPGVLRAVMTVFLGQALFAIVVVLNLWSYALEINFSVAATAMLVLSLALPGREGVVANGILLGGVFTMMLAVIVMLFIVLLAGSASDALLPTLASALATTIVVGYLRFGREAVPTPLGASRTTGPLSERDRLAPGPPASGQAIFSVVLGLMLASAIRFGVADLLLSNDMEVVLLIAVVVMLVVPLVLPRRLDTIANGILLGAAFTMVSAGPPVMVIFNPVVGALVAVLALPVAIVVGYLRLGRKAASADLAREEDPPLLDRLETLERQVDEVSKIERGNT